MQLMPFIIGRGGNTKKQLEQETGVTLIIPKGGTWLSMDAAVCSRCLHTFTALALQPNQAKQTFRKGIVCTPFLVHSIPFAVLDGALLQVYTCAAAAAGPSRPQQQQQQHPPKHQQQQVIGSSQSDTITIKGSSKQAVSSARVRTQLLIDSVISSRMLDYTHFVSIPLANKQTEAKLQEFQKQVNCREGAGAG
jgi:hypothetical protein